MLFTRLSLYVCGGEMAAAFGPMRSTKPKQSTHGTRIPVQAHTDAPRLEIETNRRRRFLETHVQEEPAGVSLVPFPQTLFVRATANCVVECLERRARVDMC